MATEEKKPVVIAMDGSEHAEYAFQWYISNLYNPNHYVIVLHVPERHAFMVGALGGTADPESMHMMIQEEKTKEKAFVEKMAEKLKHVGIGGKVKSVTGKPGEVIVSVASEEKAAFIVCGSRGKGTFRRTFIGSISDYILHHSQIPVFVCKLKSMNKEQGPGSPSIRQRIMNSPLFRRNSSNSSLKSERQSENESKD